MTLETKNLLIGMVAGGLVLCGIVHAESPVSGHVGVHCQPGYSPVIPRDQQTCAKITVVESCERTMAEAMRAMDEFVGERSTVNAIYLSPSAVLREAADREDRREAAVRQWESAKACWGPDR